jgi:hypothetical protein
MKELAAVFNSLSMNFSPGEHAPQENMHFRQVYFFACCSLPNEDIPVADGVFFFDRT